MLFRLPSTLTQPRNGTVMRFTGFKGVPSGVDCQVDETSGGSCKEKYSEKLTTKCSMNRSFWGSKVQLEMPCFVSFQGAKLGSNCSNWSRKFHPNLVDHQLFQPGVTGGLCLHQRLGPRLGQWRRLASRSHTTLDRGWSAGEYGASRLDFMCHQYRSCCWTS